MSKEYVDNAFVGEYLFGYMGGYFQKIREQLGPEFPAPSKATEEGDFDEKWIAETRKAFLNAIETVSDATATRANMVGFFNEYFHIRACERKEWNDYYTLLYVTVAKRFPDVAFPWHRGELTPAGCTIEAIKEN